MPATAKLLRIRLREDYIAQAAGELVVDRVNHVVRNLKIGGLVSKNGRRYLLEAYRQALPLYEGAHCNIDHIKDDEKDVPFDRRFAVWRNVHLTEHGPRGDLHYNPAHPRAEQFLWWCENEPTAVGFSHLADGQYDTDPTGVKIVRHIDRVYSVDLVADPATTKGLAESAPMDPTETTVPDPLAPAPLEPAADTGGDWKAKVADAIKSLMMDDAKSPDEKWAALEQMFEAIHPKGDGEGEGKVKEDEPEGKGGEMDDGCDKKTMESLRKTAAKDPAVKRLLESHDKMQLKQALAAKEQKARQLCKAAGLPAIAITEVFLESLVHAPDEKHMGRLIEDRRVLASSTPGKRPISSAPGKKDPSFDDFIAGIKDSE